MPCVECVIPARRYCRTVRDPWEKSELARRFHESAASHHPRAPLYASLSRAISGDPEMSGLLFHAPPEQRLPVLLFACVHTLVLQEPESDLAAWYPNLTTTPRSADDPALVPTFKRFVTDRAPALLALLATRRTQTNEVGRCLMLLPAFGIVADEVGELAHLDVGTSGGLNLLLDRYEYHYVSDDDREDRHVGGPSTVQLTASTRGDVGVPSTMPTVAARCGVDISPIDVTDDDEAHWLEACVWPDQRDRFLRLRAAIEIARSESPEILAGDAITSLAPAIDRLARAGHPVITNSWVLNYLSQTDRIAYVTELDRIGEQRDISWVYLGGAGTDPRVAVAHVAPRLTPHDRGTRSMARWPTFGHQPGHGASTRLLDPRLVNQRGREISPPTTARRSLCRPVNPRPTGRLRQRTRPNSR